MMIFAWFFGYEVGKSTAMQCPAKQDEKLAYIVDSNEGRMCVYIPHIKGLKQNKVKVS